MKRIVFALALLITSWSFASLTDGLVGYWPFNGNVKDGSGRGHKLSGSVAYTADLNGNDNSAAVFEGNASLKLPQSLYVARSLTVSVWCKPSGTIPTGLRDMLSQTDGSTMVGSQYVLYPSHGGLASTGKAGVGLVVGQNGVIVMEHADEYCPTPLVWYGNIGNNWTLVTVTIFGNGAPHLYINGDFIKKGMASSKTKFVGAADRSLSDVYLEENQGYYWGSVIGNGVTVDYSHCPYYGLMDDFRIYNRALSASEIKLLYEGEVVQLHAVKFDANNGEEIMEDEMVMAGADLSLPPNKFHNDGFVFQGWALSSSGEVVYKDEALITVNSDMTLYAVWASPSLTLAAESADWSSGSITLRCTDVDTSGRTHTYTLQYYDESTDTWKDVSSVQSASASVSLPDTDFSSRLGGIPPVKYRVKDENGRVSVECVTRNRFLFSIGYTAYNDWASPKVPQTYEDAKAFASLCNKLGGFKSFIWRNVETTELRTKIEEMSTLACPGDVFVFYISTHGHDSGLLSGAGITTYDGNYSAEDLQEDVRKFSSGVAVVNVIVACHSAAMTGSDDKRFWLKKMISDYRFNQCLGNIAWITSCDISQNTPVWSDFTQFGAFFIGHGFQEGYADLQLHGTDYKGGNGDGRLTLGELGRYVRELSIGISDEAPAEVQLENEGLLDRIVMAEGIVCKPLNPPPPPSNVRASKGEFDHKIRVSWTTSSAAKYYRLYRCPVNETSSPAFDWIDFVSNKVGDGPGSLDDKDVFERRILPFAMYGYRVQAMNQVGYGELSEITTDSFGWRGSLGFKNFLLNALKSFTESSIDAASVTASEYNVIESTVAANGCRTVGECYALGINPEDPDDDFRIKSFKMDGTKPVVTVNHTDDGSGASLLPRMKILGKAELSGEWEEVPEEGNPAHRFFTVTVEEP